MFQILEIKLESSVVDSLNVPGMIDKYPLRFFHCKLIYMYARMTDISSRTTEVPHARTSKRVLNLLVFLCKETFFYHFLYGFHLIWQKSDMQKTSMLHYPGQRLAALLPPLPLVRCCRVSIAQF